MTQAASVPFSQYFSGYIQDGKIYAQSWEGAQQIGVPLSVHADLHKQYDEVLAVTEGYKQRLIELGEIEVPLTQEQIIEQQAEQLRQSQELLALATAKLEELTKEVKPHGYRQSDRDDNRREPESESHDDPGPASGAGDRAKQARPPKLHSAK